MTNWPGFVELVHRHQRFVLTTHIRPDCDALGSMMAMIFILESLGKDVLTCNAFAVPRNLQFIDPRKKIRQLGVDIQAEQLNDREVWMILDTSAWAQLGAMSEVIRSFRASRWCSIIT